MSWAVSPRDRILVYFQLSVAIKTSNLSQSLSYLKTGYQLAQKQKLLSAYSGFMLNEIAETFLLLPNGLDSSFYYNQMAVNILKRTKGVTFPNNPKLNYFDYAKLTQAILLNIKESPQTALQILKEIEERVTKASKSSAIRWHQTMAITQRRLKNYSLAIDYSRKGASLIGTDNTHYGDMANYYGHMSELFELNDQADSSIHYLKNSLRYLNIAHKSKQKELAADLEAKYRGNEQRQQNLLLQAQNQQIKLRYAYYIGLSIALLVILMILVVSYSKLSKKNRVIADQSQQLVSFNAQLSDALVNVKTLTDAKRQLVSLFVHDLRTPLQIIQLKLGIFDLQHPGNKIVEEVQAASEHIHHTLLKIMEAENENLIKIENTMRSIPISPLIQGVIDRLKAVAMPKGLQLSYAELSPAPEVVASYELLSHVVENLVSNAIKFSPEKGRINVAVNASPEKVMISVKDEGPGIPKEKIDELFKTRNPNLFNNEGGLGIGLSLCRNYMELMHGAIRVESALGAGTTFYLEFDKALR